MIKSRRMRRAGLAAHMIQMRNAFKILVIKPEGKRSHGRPRHRWEDSMKMDLTEMGWEGADWIHFDCNGGWWWVLVNI
jgi:hypothetical protein